MSWSQKNNIDNNVLSAPRVLSRPVQEKDPKYFSKEWKQRKGNNNDNFRHPPSNNAACETGEKTGRIGKSAVKGVPCNLRPTNLENTYLGFQNRRPRQLGEAGGGEQGVGTTVYILFQNQIITNIQAVEA